MLLLLAEQALIADWRSEVLGVSLDQFLAASRTGSLIILFLGLPDSHDLPRTQRSIRAVLLAISSETRAENRRLRRLFLAGP